MSASVETGVTVIAPPSSGPDAVTPDATGPSFVPVTVRLSVPVSDCPSAVALNVTVTTVVAPCASPS